MKKFIIILLLAVLIIVAFIFTHKSNDRTKEEVVKESYDIPSEYAGFIENYSALYNVPPEIVCAVIKAESDFDPSSVSHAGAIGLMQITEPTLWWLQSKLGETHTTEELYDSETNIKYGTFFLSLLYTEFGDWQTVYAAYNAGRTKVNGWLKDESVSQNGVLIDIPIEETANYVKKVAEYRIKYHSVYYPETQTGENQ